MEVMDIALVVIMTFYQFGIQTLVLNLVSLLGSLVWKIFTLLAFALGRVISACIFVPLFAVVWIFERYFGYHSASLEPSSSVPTLTNSSPTQASRAGRDGIPEDWVTIRLCLTDEISDFELEDKTVVVTKTLDGMFEGLVGSWEKRELFEITREEIVAKVTSWLDSLDEEIKTGSIGT